MGDEAVALDDMMECFEVMADRVPRNIGPAVTTYEYNKASPVGSSVFCPVCYNIFKKATYHHVFCSNKGNNNCKDKYHNHANPSRLARFR